VEVDSSFYKTPSKSMAAGWAKATGASFKFSLLLPSSLGNLRQDQRAEKDAEMFLRNLEPIASAEKLGCLLLHLSNAFTFAELALLESRLELVPNKFHLAVEFGHPSWNRIETWRMLARRNVATAISDYQVQCPEPVFTSNTHAYIRWHGLGKDDRRDYKYSEGELAGWIEKLREIERRVPVVYAYFCNHSNGNAPANLLTFLEMRGQISEAQTLALKRYRRSQRKRPPRDQIEYS
jgi:uncharacterized protein YecE (DUF72 family)